MTSLFQLPEELLLSSLFERFPCRERQIRSLATLLHPAAAPCRNLIVYGTEATGKSAIVESLLQKLSKPPDEEPESEPKTSLSFAIVNSIQCITGRHLFERTIAAVVEAIHWESPPKKCETLAQLMVEMCKMLKYTQRPDGWRLVLVFDAIDQQRDAPASLLPALARLSEVIPCLTCVFIVTAPSPSSLRTSFVPHIQFPNYTKQEFIKIISASPPSPTPTTTQDDTDFLWTRFVGAVCDALTTSASRTLPSCRHSCDALWARFTAPILARTHGPREFSKLLIASRVHFQDESLLNPSIVSIKLGNPSSTTAAPTTRLNGHTPAGTPSKHGTPSSKHGTTAHTALSTATADLTTLLPTTTRLLLLAAYLASHNAPRHDLTLFSTYHHGRRKRRGGGFVAPKRGRPSKHKKISRKLLGAHAFVLERMLAIFAAVRSEWAAADVGGFGTVGGSVVDGDVGMAISTLASLRLLMKVGTAGDPMDRGGKWRINVGWDIIRGVGRSVGIEVEEWLID
ncbi:origin recognition complex subunit 5 C-terminus-domain-containing protein [Colletotrichum godetiae]|uniref:Origin recognition complex subunit 5 C-terminus-domain-containing protein n=1 Tax=Colletotrichum godetiae TaxID=1209918 RepID=A0AAJ0ARX1_9PEZI|nr:origin recognition complex subunit 5 C-terminus-domain-containing protein [Colletotrichum godetiae]KAK1688532.1 origin recognition complex subunit 5 C-terminus-domain-containing protein [Colletotrichum godetiae]